MRKFNALLGVMMVCLGLCACRPAKVPAPTLTSTGAPPALSLRLPTSTPTVILHQLPTSPVREVTVPANQSTPTPTVSCQSSLFPTPEVTSPIVCQLITTSSPPAIPISLSEAWQFWSSAVSWRRGAFTVAPGDNVMWVGTATGVRQLDPSSWACTAFTEPGPTSYILPIENDQVLTAGDRGVFHYDSQTWHRVTFSTTSPLDTTEVHLLGVDGNGDLWLMEDQWFHFKGHVPPRDGAWPEADDNAFIGELSDVHWQVLASERFTCRTLEGCKRLYGQLKQYGRLTVDTDGVPWLVNDTDLLRVDEDGSNVPILYVPYINSFTADLKHHVWLATAEGLFTIEGTSLRRVSLNLDHSKLYSPSKIAVDTSGNAWAITEYGLQRLSADDQEWKLIDDAELKRQRAGAPVSRLVAAHDGGVWLTNGKSELVHYDGRTLYTAPPRPDIHHCSLGELTVDTSGNVWFPSVSCGLMQFDPTTHAWQQHLPGESIEKVSIGVDGTVYVLNRENQLKRYSSAQATWQTVAQLEGPRTWLIAADRQGGVWAGTYTVDDTTDLRWYPPDFSAPTVMRTPVNIDCCKTFNLFVDRQNRLWATAADEVMRLDGDQWQTVTIPPIGAIVATTIASDGRVWFAGKHGIAVYDPAKDKQP